MGALEMIITGFCVGILIIILLSITIISLEAIKERKEEKRKEDLLNQTIEREAKDALEKLILINIILGTYIKDKEDK